MAVYAPSGRAGEYASLALNVYNGCAHGCVYCFAPGVMRRTREDFHARILDRKPGFLDEVAKDVGNADPDTPILLSFITDPYQPVETERMVTRKVLEIVAEKGRRVCVLTKGHPDLVARDMGLLVRCRAEVAVTLTMDNDTDSKRVEPLAALPQERIDVLRQAKEAGLSTWVSIEPVVSPDQSLAMVERAAPWCDLFKVGKMNHFGNGTDWPVFRKNAVSLLNRLGKRYILKKDLEKAS